MSDLKNLKEDDQFFYKHVGFGLITYERGRVLEQNDGILYTDAYDEDGMEWSEEEQTWIYDTTIGYVSYVLSIDDKFAAEKAKLPKTKRSSFM